MSDGEELDEDTDVERVGAPGCPSGKAGCKVYVFGVYSCEAGTAALGPVGPGNVAAVTVKLAPKLGMCHNNNIRV